MKKISGTVALFPFLLMGTGVIFASNNGSAMQLSEVSDDIKALMQEREGQPKPPQPPPPAPVDTTHAYNAGLRDGMERGSHEGRREGRSDGINEGEREGYRRGTDDGDRAGRETGYRDGYGVDQTMGAQSGGVAGKNAGTDNGSEAGRRRCYDEGYSSGYNTAYEEAKNLGLQDAASYSAGYAKGRADAAVMEVESGRKAGYQAGFSQREAELQNSLGDARGNGLMVTKASMELAGMINLPIGMARSGFDTQEERHAYEEGYKDGYHKGYRRAYDDAKRDGYNERFPMAYRRAYDEQYSISYRDGFSRGKAEGYKAAYDAAYNNFYSEHSSREYADQRARGMSNGRAAGQTEGFEDGCAEQTKRGYHDGYQKAAGEVCPGAFETGKQAGIAAADKYYAENSVLKVSGMAFYDEDNNGKFEAGENVMLRAEVRNFGFRKSDIVAIMFGSERGEITFVPSLRVEEVGGRSRMAVDLSVGRLYDVVAPDADALYVKFVEKGSVVGERRQLYSRTNPNRVGVVSRDGTPVRNKAGWFFSETLATLSRGEKILIVGEKGDFYKVRKSGMAIGAWTEGYIDNDRVTLQ